MYVIVLGGNVTANVSYLCTVRNPRDHSIAWLLETLTRPDKHPIVYVSRRTVSRVGVGSRKIAHTSGMSIGLPEHGREPRITGIRKGIVLRYDYR